MNKEEEIEKLKEAVQFTLDNVEKSKVEDSSTKEDFLYYTEDVEEWKKLFDNDNIKQAHKELDQEVVFDDEIIKNSTGFALGPVTRYDKKMYPMVSHKASSLEEIKETLKDKKYILYLIFHRINEYEVDDITFTFKKLETPQQVYTFRGCFLD
jgi:hypothetical protein